MFGFGTKYWKMKYSETTPYGELVLMSVCDLGTPDDGQYICLIIGKEYDQGKKVSARFKFLPNESVMAELKKSRWRDWFEKYGKLLSEWWMKNNKYNAATFLTKLWENNSDLARDRVTPGMYLMDFELKEHALYR